MQDTKGELQVGIKLVRPRIGQVRHHLKLVRPYFLLCSTLYKHGSTMDVLTRLLIKKLAKYVMILTDISLIIYKYNGLITKVNAWMYILNIIWNSLVWTDECLTFARLIWWLMSLVQLLYGLHWLLFMNVWCYNIVWARE